jgi:hypothetical protein
MGRGSRGGGEKALGEAAEVVGQHGEGTKAAGRNSGEWEQQQHQEKV